MDWETDFIFEGRRIRARVVPPQGATMPNEVHTGPLVWEIEIDGNRRVRGPVAAHRQLAPVEAQQLIEAHSAPTLAS